MALFIPWVIGEEGSPRQTEQAWAAGETPRMSTATMAAAKKDCFVGKERLLAMTERFLEPRSLAHLIGS